MYSIWPSSMCKKTYSLSKNKTKEKHNLNKDWKNNNWWVLKKQNVSMQRLHCVNHLRRQRKRKVLAFKNAVQFSSASVECFVKVQVCVYSMKICFMLVLYLWWQKAPICSNLNFLSLDSDSAHACYGVTPTQRKDRAVMPKLLGICTFSGANTLPFSCCITSDVGAVALLAGFWLKRRYIIWKCLLCLTPFLSLIW